MKNLVRQRYSEYESWECNAWGFVKECWGDEVQEGRRWVEVTYQDADGSGCNECTERGEMSGIALVQWRVDHTLVHKVFGGHLHCLGCCCSTKGPSFNRRPSGLASTFPHQAVRLAGRNVVLSSSVRGAKKSPSIGLEELTRALCLRATWSWTGGNAVFSGPTHLPCYFRNALAASSCRI